MKIKEVEIYLLHSRYFKISNDDKFVNFSEKLDSLVLFLSKFGIFAHIHLFWSLNVADVLRRMIGGDYFNAGMGKIEKNYIYFISGILVL